MWDLGNGASLRLATPKDLPNLLQICLKTSDAGADGSDLYTLKELVGDIYVTPYVLHQPEFAYLLEVDGTASGYVLGVLDTAQFERDLAANYWPKAVRKYSQIQQSLSESDKRLLDLLFSIKKTTEDILSLFPSHLHIDILEPFQGRGYGKEMINHLLEELTISGSSGVHLHVSSKNLRAHAFYKKLGFDEISVFKDELILAIHL